MEDNDFLHFFVHLFKARYFNQASLKIGCLLALLQGLWLPLGAHSLPAFARQTGQNWAWFIFSEHSSPDLMERIVGIHESAS